jgi:hypothetical protein
LGLDVEVQEVHALRGQRVDAGRRCAAQDAAAINAEFAVAEVIHQDEDYVGFRRLLRDCWCVRNRNGSG